MVLKIYGDYLSQPTRAVLVFASGVQIIALVAADTVEHLRIPFTERIIEPCELELRNSSECEHLLIDCFIATTGKRAVNIDHEVKDVRISKMEHKRPEFLAMNPTGKVPAIDDDGFALFESHAILRYLATTRSAPDHWYPADPKKRAIVDCILDWHHLNLREGSKILVFQKVLGKGLGIPYDEKAVERSEKILNASLDFITDNWLSEEGPFLGGSSQPSIADLSLVCEVKQLELLNQLEREALLGTRKKIQKWAQATEGSLAPHFAGVHSLLKMISRKSQAKRDAQKHQSSL